MTLMLPTTLDIIKSALKSDQSLSPSARARWLATLRHGPDLPKPPIPATPRILRRKTAAERIGRSIRALDLLAQQGVLRRIKFPGRQRSAGFLENDVNKLLA
jgi:hypothetical protein